MDERRLEVRLGRLERQNRLLKLAMLAIAGIVGSAVLMGAAVPPQVVRVKGLILEDDQGRERAHLVMLGDLPTLSLLNPGGGTSVSLQALSDRGGSGLYLYDGQGRTRVELGVNTAANIAGSHLFLRTSQGDLQAALSGDKNMTVMELYDPSQLNQRAELGCRPQQGPRLLLADQSGNVLFAAPK